MAIKIIKKIIARTTQRNAGRIEGFTPSEALNFLPYTAISSTTRRSA